MSALGQKQTCAAQKIMSALPPKVQCPLLAHSGHLFSHRECLPIGRQFAVFFWQPPNCTVT
ncbi:MAG: hypothetical protein WA683_25525, partial [Pseudolabrys sp.]